MRNRTFTFLLLLALLLQACQVSSGGIPTATVTLTPAPTVTQTNTSLPPTATQTPTPVFTVTPEPSPTVTPDPLYGYQVHFHPEDGLYVGDIVSLEVLSPPNRGDGSKQMQVTGPDGKDFGTVDFGPYGMDGRNQATFYWVWDTHALKPGSYSFTFHALPSGPTFQQSVTLLPPDQAPFPGLGVKWESAHSQCCVFYYIQGTAAERDISKILPKADEQAQDAINKLGIQFSQPITVTILPRVLGQGGFAGDEISISYLDRNYSGNNFDMVLHHEMIHILDGRLKGDLRPSMFVEGLAVYETGGHFKPEPLRPRAAALLKLPGNQLDNTQFIPLQSLADNFYPAQHEIGYLEGAALIDFMVRTWSWQAFNDFYRDIHSDPSGSQSKAINTALQKHFNLKLDELQNKFLDDLRSQPVTQIDIDDLRLTVNYFDTMRRYQQLMDPSAYFRTVWLLDNKQMRQRGIVADYLRHPTGAENIAIETMLVRVRDALLSSQYDQADQLLPDIQAVLDAVEQQKPDPFTVNSLAADYLAIVQALQNAGYEAQEIQLNGDQAQVRATSGSTTIVSLTLIRQGDQWVIK